MMGRVVRDGDDARANAILGSLGRQGRWMRALDSSCHWHWKLMCVRNATGGIG